VIENVGPGVKDGPQRRVEALEVGISTSMRHSGTRWRVGGSSSAKMNAPPSARSSRSTDVMTACRSAIRSIASATRAGSARSSSFGLPCGDHAVGARARADVAENQ